MNAELNLLKAIVLSLKDSIISPYDAQWHADATDVAFGTSPDLRGFDYYKLTSLFQ